MCGILGELRSGTEVGFGISSNAEASLLHRGPDESASWRNDDFLFFHHRLAIIDPENGRQPMCSKDGRYVLICNAEIYNFRSLRVTLEAQGISFDTDSDTEVILKSYQYWGHECVRQFEGFFAIAIADTVKRTLFLARDRIGEKPLYLERLDNGGVRFASEPKALFPKGVSAADIDENALYDFLCFNYVSGSKTLVKRIERFEPGCYEVFTKDSGAQRTRYWSVAGVQGIEAPSNEIDLKKNFIRRFDEAVRYTLTSDVPVTLLLSGGIDSSLVSESAVRQGNIKVAYCVTFEDKRFSELEKAKQVAKALGIELRPVVCQPPDTDRFARLVRHFDDPLADASGVAVDSVCDEIKKDFKVAITGDGGDELFGGYLTYKATDLLSKLNRIVPRRTLEWISSFEDFTRLSDGKVPLSFKLYRFTRAINRLPAEAHFTWNGSWLPEEADHFMAFPRGADVTDPLQRKRLQFGLAEMPSQFDLKAIDLNDLLPNDMLTKTDRMSMLHGVELRTPFLTKAIAEYAISCGQISKFSKLMNGKRLLRSRANDLFGTGIGMAKKQGFSIPIHSWLRKEMRETLEHYLSPPLLSDVPWLNADAVLKVKNDHLSGRYQRGYELWGLMTLVCWWQIFGAHYEPT